MAVITPRWLPVDEEEHLGESAPVAFQYGYRDRELAGKNTRMEAIFSLHCYVQRDDAPPLASVVHVLGFRPVVVYQLQKEPAQAFDLVTIKHERHALCDVSVRASRLCSEMQRLKAHLNTTLHQKFASRPELATPDAVYVVDCQCEEARTDSGEASTVRLRICRPSDVRPFHLTAALVNFITALGTDRTEVQLMSGEKSYGRKNYTDVSAAKSFKEAFRIQYDTVLCAEGLIERPAANGLAVFYLQVSGLQNATVTRESTLGFFENPEYGSFDKKIYGREPRVYPKQAMAERDAKQRLLTDADYKRHAEEYLLRITWNLRHGVVPAQQKIHLADPERTEASDTRFAFGVPPFHEDGSPNPLGIPDNRVIEVNSHALD